MVKEMVRQGGRSARIQAEVHRAVDALSRELDRADLTVPMIAERAGVTPSTIYRRWGDLAQLLADVAVQRLRPIADPQDTGAMATDLEVWLLQFTDEMSSPTGRALLRDVFAGSVAPAQPQACWRYTYDQLEIMADRARARGEAGFDVEGLIDRAVAPIIYHILFADRPITEDYVRALLPA